MCYTSSNLEGLNFEQKEKSYSQDEVDQMILKLKIKHDDCLKDILKKVELMTKELKRVMVMTKRKKKAPRQSWKRDYIKVEKMFGICSQGHDIYDLAMDEPLYCDVECDNPACKANFLKHKAMLEAIL